MASVPRKFDRVPLSDCRQRHHGSNKCSHPHSFFVIYLITFTVLPLLLLIPIHVVHKKREAVARVVGAVPGCWAYSLWTVQPLQDLVPKIGTPYPKKGNLRPKLLPTTNKSGSRFPRIHQIVLSRPNWECGSTHLVEPSNVVTPDITAFSVSGF